MRTKEEIQEKLLAALQQSKSNNYTDEIALNNGLILNVIAEVLVDIRELLIKK